MKKISFKKLFLLFYSQIQKRRFNSCGYGFRLHFPSLIEHPEKIDIGNNVSINVHCWLNCIENSQNDVCLKIGNGCCIGRFVHINAYEEVIFEDDVLIADRVHISDVSHTYKNYEIPILYQKPEFMGSVRIKKGAWVGVGAVILPGVTIGRNSVIGANSVVTKDVPDFHVARGVPAQNYKI